jgi:hypothetical protein
MHRTFDSYIAQRLLNANKTSFVNEQGVDESLKIADGNARLSQSHTLLHGDMYAFNNENDKPLQQILPDAMAEFYKNSLYAGDPCVADIILCNENVVLPDIDLSSENRTQELPTFQRLSWEHDAWFLFSSRHGFLSDKWWHIYGYVPDVSSN